MEHVAKVSRRMEGLVVNIVVFLGRCGQQLDYSRRYAFINLASFKN